MMNCFQVLVSIFDLRHYTEQEAGDSRSAAVAHQADDE